MWRRDLSYIDSLNYLFPKYRFKTPKRSKDNIKIILPPRTEIDFTVLKDMPIENNLPPKEITINYSDKIEQVTKEMIILSLLDNLQVNSPELYHPKPFHSSFPSDADILEINKRVFGNKSFKKYQKEIINAVFNKKDVVVYLPSGRGKNLTYKLPTICMKGVTFIITNFIPIMKSQIKTFDEHGMNVSVINTPNISNVSNHCNEILKNHNVKLVFLTPKLLLEQAKIADLITNLNSKQRINFFVIDESKYRNSNTKSYQSDYKTYNYLKINYPKIPLLYFSSCPSLQKLKDKANSINSPPEYFIGNPQRPNIFYQVISKQTKKISQLINIIETRFPNETGIIYYNKKSKSHNFFKQLKEKYSLNCIFYHPNHTTERKTQTLTTWLDGNAKILITPTPFDIKINNPSIRFIIQYHLPTSLFEFYQNSGYAGRDSSYSECIILYNFKNRKMFYKSFNSKLSKDQKANFMIEMYKILEFCEDRSRCRKVLISKYLGSDEDFDCNFMCDNCRNHHGKEDFSDEDYTDMAFKIIDLMKSCHGKIWTFKRLERFLSGGKLKENELYRRPDYGRFRNRYGDNTIKRIILRMLLEKLLEGVLQDNRGEKKFILKSRENLNDRIKQRSPNIVRIMLNEEKEEDKENNESNDESSEEVEEGKRKYHDSDEIILPYKRK